MRLHAAFLKNTLGLSERPTDEAPKLFAARMGFQVVVILLASQIFQLDMATWILGGMLAFFAFLESALAICVGCIVYQQLVSLKIISRESV